MVPTCGEHPIVGICSWIPFCLTKRHFQCEVKQRCSHASGCSTPDPPTLHSQANLPKSRRVNSSNSSTSSRSREKFDDPSVSTMYLFLYLFKIIVSQFGQLKEALGQLGDVWCTNTAPARVGHCDCLEASEFEEVCLIIPFKSATAAVRDKVFK